MPQLCPIPKPKGWNDLPLYEKIGVYGRHMTAEHAKYVDKLIAKDIVKQLLGDTIEVGKVIRVLNGWRDLKRTDMNHNHIIKTAHASGWNINITNTTDYLRSLYQLREWNTAYQPKNEVQYSYLRPCFFIEEKIEDPITGNDGNCLVYMFRYIHGTRVSIGVGCDGNLNHYDENWNLILPPTIPTPTTPTTPIPIPKPKRLDDMLNMSHTLAQGFEFVRIDMFYGKNDTIYFSEFTFTPKAGKPVFPLHMEHEYGKLWT